MSPGWRDVQCISRDCAGCAPVHHDGSTARSGLPEMSNCAAISCCIGMLARPDLYGLPIGTRCVILLAAL
eukprot:218307-Pyramimonas_sp.AAC.1